MFDFLDILHLEAKRNPYSTRTIKKLDRLNLNFEQGCSNPQSKK